MLKTSPLLPFNRREQCLEVALAEAIGCFEDL